MGRHLQSSDLGNTVSLGLYSNNLATAVSAIGASLSTLIISESITVTSNLDIPSNIILVIPKGKIITINTGVTLTIYSPFNIGAYQVFSGSGKVVFEGPQSYVLPEWWGAIADGITDSKSAIQFAINSGVQRIRFATKGTYFLSDYIEVNFTSGRTPRGPIKIDGNGSTITRTTTGIAGSFNPILYVNNPNEYSTTVSVDIVEKAHQITVADATNITAGDVLYISSTEVWSTRLGVGTEYYKSYHSRVISKSGNNVILADAAPYSFDSGETITVDIWNTRCPVHVHDLHLEWDTLDTGETQGIYATYAHRSIFERITTDNVTVAGIRTEGGYDVRFNELSIDLPTQAVPLQLEYGMLIAAATRLVVNNSSFKTSRHPIAFSGNPSYLCEVNNCQLITDGASSGSSFDAHTGEDITIRGCYLNDGAKFAGGHYKFIDCDIHTRSVNTVFSIREIIFLKSLTIRDCRLFLNGGKPGQTTDRTYILNLGTPLAEEGYIDFGDFTLTNNDIYNNSSQMVIYDGDNVTTDFSMPFYFDNSSTGVVVYLRTKNTVGDSAETTQTLTTHYTLSGAQDPAGGLCQMVTPPTSSQRLVITYMANPALVAGFNWTRMPNSWGDWVISNNRFYGLFGGIWSFTGGGLTKYIIPNSGNLIIKDNIGDFGGFGSTHGLFGDILIQGNRPRSPATGDKRPPYFYTLGTYWDGGAESREVIIRDNVSLGGFGILNNAGNTLLEDNTILWQIQAGLPLSTNKYVTTKNNSILRIPSGTSGWSITNSSVYHSGNTTPSGINVFSGTPSGLVSPLTNYAGKGTTGARPTLKTEGSLYLDTTLDSDGKPIVWNGVNWVDADGGVV